MDGVGHYLRFIFVSSPRTRSSEREKYNHKKRKMIKINYVQRHRTRRSYTRSLVFIKPP